jgi:phosphatidylinositol-3-phosphatase
MDLIGTKAGTIVLIAAAALLLLNGCSSAVQTPSPNTASTQEPATPSITPASTDKPTVTVKPTLAPSPTPKQISQDTNKGVQVTPSLFPNIKVDHIVVVIEENHSYQQIVGKKDAPYFNQLIEKGALLTNSHAITHPSQPNYLALFSGSTQGMKDDSCGKTYSGDNLASELIKNKLTFVGYSEDLPKPGFSGCSSKGYARKHNPWIQFTNVSADLNQPLTSFPQDYSKLPTISFVIPNHQDDMHDGTIGQADTWLKKNIDDYVTWAATHNSLLIVTWDEDDNAKDNHIPTIFVGPMVKTGKYDEKINHYNVLRTMEDLFHLPTIGDSAKADPITAIWKSN